MQNGALFAGLQPNVPRVQVPLPRPPQPPPPQGLPLSLPLPLPEPLSSTPCHLQGPDATDGVLEAACRGWERGHVSHAPLANTLSMPEWQPACPSSLLGKQHRPAMGLGADVGAAAVASLAAPASTLPERPSPLAYLDALCMREYQCRLAQLPRALRPQLVELAMLDLADYVPHMTLHATGMGGGLVSRVGFGPASPRSKQREVGWGWGLGVGGGGAG